MENGNATVFGNGDFNWTNVEVNNWLVINGVIYFIADITDKATGVLILSEVYRGSTATTSDYVIVRDFTASRNLPLVNPGDQEVAALLSRAMQIIDPLLGGTAAGEEISLTQTSHGFAVGNCLYLNGTTWAMANASASSTANVVAMVCEVVDTSNFKVKTNGLVTGITGITLVPKTVYYLRTSTTSSLNLTPTAPTAPNVTLPMLVAVTSNSGFLLSLGIARPAAFTDTNNGLVPAPNGSTGFLKNDGTWASTGITDASIEAKHIDNSNVVVDYATLDDPTSTQSLIRHIIDLNDRIEVLESQTNGGAYTRHVFTRASNTSLVADITDMVYPKKATMTVGGVGALDIPSNIGYIVLGAISGHTVNIRKPSNSAYYREWTVMPPYKLKYIVGVAPGDQFHLYIGTQRRSAAHTSNPAGATNIMVYKGATKVIDLVGNMRTGKRDESGDQVNHILWQGNYIHPSITQYNSHPTDLAILHNAYAKVVDPDWISAITVNHVESDTQPNTKTQNFWAGMIVVEWGFGASPFVA